MEVELATSIGQQDTLNLLHLIILNQSYLSGFRVLTSQEKKNHFRHLSPKFRNQMEHSS